MSRFETIFKNSPVFRKTLPIPPAIWVCFPLNTKGDPMNTLFRLLLIFLLPTAQAFAKPFQSKQIYVCYPSELMVAVENDCTLTPVLDALNSIDPSATKDVLDAALMVLGQKVTNYVIGCEVTKIKVDLEDQATSSRAIYTDTTTLALRETVVSVNGDTISLPITLTGFASGLPVKKTLSIQTKANEQYLHEATVKGDNGADDFVCYSQDVSK